MRNFVINLMMFGFGLLIINIISYVVIARPALLTEYMQHKDERLHDYKKVLFADSHGKAVKQEHLDRIGVYNFSHNADSYYDIYIKLVYLIREGVDIEAIFLTADGHALSEYREITNNVDRSILYSDYVSFKDCYSISFLEYIYKQQVMTYLPYLNTSNSKPFERYIRTKLRIVFPKSATTSEKKLWEAASISQRIADSRERYMIQFDKKGRSEDLERILNLIILLCKKNDIKIIGVKFPLAKEYLSIIGEKSFGADESFEKHNIQIVDLKDAFIDCDDCFKDQDHVNEKGSEKFVEKLIQLTKNARIEYQSDRFQQYYPLRLLIENFARADTSVQSQWDY